MKLLKDNYWVKSGFFSLLHRSTLLLFGLIGFYILIRFLSKEEYGVWMLFMSFTTLTEVLRSGFIRNPLIKYLNSSGKEEHESIIGTSMLLNVALTSIIILIILVFAGVLSSIWHAEGLEVILRLYVFTSIILIPFSHFEYLMEAKFNYKGIFYCHFARQGLFLLYIIGNAIFGTEFSLVDLAIAQIVTTLMAAILAYFYLKGQIMFSIVYKKVWRDKLFSFGKYTFGAHLSSILMGNVDQWMLSSMISPVAVAIYNPALRITHLVDVPTISVASIVFPKLTSRIRTEGVKVAKYLYEKSVGLIMAIVIPSMLFILVFSDAIVYLIAGEKYAETIPILQVTILYSLFMPFGRQMGIVLDSMGLPKVSFYFILLKVVINVICNYIFITNFGIIGAAWGTLCSLGLGFVFNTIYLKSKINVNPLNVFLYMGNFYRDGFFFAFSYVKRHLKFVK